MAAASGATAPDDPPDACTITGEILPLLPGGSDAADRNARSGVVVPGVGQLYRWVTSPAAPFRPFAPTTIPHSTYPLPAQLEYLSGCWGNMAPSRQFSLNDTYYQQTQVARPVGVSRGSALAMDLSAAPSPGDFLPPSPTIGGSSVCLLPPGSAGASTTWQGAGRATLEGSVDLVTGVPLVQTTDLELPFGAATFRLTRTRSADRLLRATGEREWTTAMTGHTLAGDRWWDWVGLGWMASENPVLLFDSALPDVVGDGPRTTWLWLDAHHSIPFQQVYHPPAGGLPARVTYEAPPRFRARMEVKGGVWGVPSAGSGIEGKGPAYRVGGWTTRPTQVDVLLYDGLLRYTFVLVNEDVPPNVWNRKSIAGESDDWVRSSMHDRPFLTRHFQEVFGPTVPPTTLFQPLNPSMSPGLGIPQYGLCVKIADQHGHAVEIAYCDSVRRSVDRGDSECIECMQDCAARGQIKYVKLSAQGVVKWTLVYAHRRFLGSWGEVESGNLGLASAVGYLGGAVAPASGLDWLTPWSTPISNEQGPRAALESTGGNAIDRIYAFQGDLSAALLEPACLSISSADRPGANPDGSFNWDLDGGIDPIAAWNTLVAQSPNIGVALPVNWKHQVRYHYDVWAADAGSSEAIATQTYFRPTLVKTTVRTRTPTGPESSATTHESRSTRSYVYEGRNSRSTGTTGNDYRMGDLPWLRLIFTDEDLDRALAAAHTDQNLGLGNLTRAQLEQWRYVNGTGEFVDLGSGRLEAFASLNLATLDTPSPDGVRRWPTGSMPLDEPDGQYPSVDALKDYRYLRPDATEFWADDEPKATVSRLIVGSEATGQRLYRIHRLIVPPNPAANPNYPGTRLPSHDPFTPSRRPSRSLFAHPFAWRTATMPYEDTAIVGGFDASPDLSKCRWITIVDEFRTEVGGLDPYGVPQQGAVELEPGISYNLAGVKPGVQTGRRVVEMNAAGHVLRDRRWTFAADGTADASGGGLGEQYVYQRAEVVLKDLIVQAGAPATLAAPSDPQRDDAGNADLVPRSVRDELLLVEKRSVGWSAVELANQSLDPDDSVDEYGETIDKATHGLVEFRAYRLVDDQSRPTLSSQGVAGPPYKKRVEQWGAGIQSGSVEVTSASPPIILPNPNRLFAGKVLSVHNETGGENSSAEITLEFLTPVGEAVFASLNAPASVGSVDAAYLLGLRNAGYRATATITWRRLPPAPDPNDPTRVIVAREQPVISRLVIGPPRQQRPFGAYYFPVDKEWYDDSGTGHVVWSASGLVKNPLTPVSGATAGPGEGEQPLDALIFTYYQRFPAASNFAGQAEHTVLDAAAGDTVTGLAAEVQPVNIPGSWPETGWARLPAGLPAGNYVTSFLYDANGLRDTFFPNGRRWARRLVTIPRGSEPAAPGLPAPFPDLFKDPLLADPFPAVTQDELDAAPDYVVREYIFNDCEFSNGAWRSLAPGEVRDYLRKKPEGSPRVTRRGSFVTITQQAYDIEAETAATIPLENFTMDAALALPLQELVRAKAGIDATGRLRKADLLEFVPGFGMMQLGTKMVNDLGEVHRELELDGNITRLTRNALGQTLRRYVGTRDEGWADAGPISQPNPYNMVLVERTEYGRSYRDAWLPTTSRRYARSPDWALDHYGPGVQPDIDGIPTVTRYDRRMRPVRTDTYTRGEPAASRRQSTTLTYFDHANRPYLTVSFGAGQFVLPASHDPARLPIDHVPSDVDIAAFFSMGVPPTSIVETIYDIDGSATQRRTYDMAWNGTGSPPRQIEFTNYGRGGAEVFSMRPGQGATISTTDAYGRTTSVANTLAVPPGSQVGASPDYRYEMTRTDSVYDRDGNVVESARWDRVKPEGAALTLSNAVRTRTVSWYDHKKRLIATADLGTEQAGGYVAGSAAFVRGAAPNIDLATRVVNRQGVPAAAPLTIMVYNRRDQQAVLVAPSGSATVSHYTGTGRLHTKIENAFDQNQALRRKTTYGYEVGRLSSIRADRIAGGGSTPTVTQETSVTYREPQSYNGGPSTGFYNIVDETFTPVSANNALATALWFPKPDTGAGTPTAGPASSPDLFIRYNFAGQVAERFDARGCGFRYRYDDLGRLASIEIVRTGLGLSGPSGTVSAGYPVSMDAPAGAVPATAASAPRERVGYVEYTHDTAGRLSDIVAWDQRQPPGGVAARRVIAHNRYTYDDNGRVTADYQSIGQLILADQGDFNGDGNVDPDDLADYLACYFAVPPCPGGDINGDSMVDPEDMAEFIAAYFGPRPPAYPFTGYAWAHQNTAENVHTHPLQPGHTRLLDMAYPVHEGVTMSGRNVAFGYGQGPSSPEHVLSRISAINDSHANNIATFAYTGSGRRATMWLGVSGGAGSTYAVGQTYAPPPSDATTVGLPGLDAFGRIARLHYQRNISTGEATLLDYQYAYDASGNRLSAEARRPWTPSGAALGAHSRERSTYDGLDRLVTSALDAMTVNGQGQSVAVGSPLRSEAWTLDLLGNWVGGAAAGTTGPPTPPNPPGRVVSGTSAALAVLDGDGATSLSHGVDGRNRITGITRGDGQANITTAPGYDPAGNLAFDGEYSYQYDAWNRLVQVNRAAWDPGVPATGGSPATPAGVVVGVLVKRYAFDGLGRLIKTESPRPDPETAGSITAPGEARVEKFYYDGIRRIQEVVEDLSAPATATPTDLDSRQVLARFLSREYVWGPGDGPAGVDELLAQFEGAPRGVTDPAAALAIQSTPWWVLQDAGGDVVGLAETPAPVSGVAQPTAVAAQFVYDAYGAVLSAEHLRAHPFMRVGHKGLFFDRLDVGIVESSGPGAAALPRLVPVANGVYHVRNRACMPRHGRWLQSDPNATGMAVIATAAKHGRGLTAKVSPLDLEALVGDGASLYQYVRSSPVTAVDPLGLMVGAVANFVPGPGDFITGMLESLVTEYAANQEWDAEWAGDWQSGDDLHTRGDNSWVEMAMLEGLYDAFEVGIGDYTVNPLDAFEMKAGMAVGGPASGQGGKAAGKGVRAGRSVGKLIGKVFDTYSEAAKYTKGKGGRIQAHKIAEKRHLRESHDPNDLPAVILTKNQHQAITNKLRARMPYGDQYNKALVWRNYQDVYRDHPEWLDKIRPLYE